MELTDTLKEYALSMAASLHGSDRRVFMARTVRLLGPGGQRRAEQQLGWNRVTIRKGMHELVSGIRCLDAFCLRGRPPYHSKYNPIERCWGILENHWSGELLDQVPTALRFARTMTWHGKHPLVQLIRKSYKKGARLTSGEMRELETQIHRLPGLDKWFVDIPPSN